MRQDNSGTVFRAQSYSIQDGPGLRKTFFMKGCSLACKWCHNPESVDGSPELLTRDIKCQRCGKCVTECPVGAITMDNQGVRRIDRQKCDLCFRCAQVCSYGALEVVGKRMTIDEVVAEIEKDEVFYRRSGGGITISGGEPLLQAPFVRRILQACRDRNLHTTLDTSGCVPWPVLGGVIDLVDLVLLDIKHMDTQAHKEGTGVDNGLILANARLIPATAKVWLRVPLISGFNDSDENILSTVKLGLDIHAEKISLLPYHDLGVGKYSGLGRDYQLPDAKAPGADRVEALKRLCEESGLPCTVGF
jgi:pyruvate formate lyase activating enzyme